MSTATTHIETDKQLFPALRFKEFDTEWPIRPLGNECNHITYGLTVRPDFVDVGIPLISAREVKTGEVNVLTAPKISQDEFNKLSDKAKPKKGDVFLTKTGTIGFSARFMLDIPIAITQNIAVIRLSNNERNSANYLIQYFKTQDFYRSAISRVNQSTIMDLQLGDIKKILIPFPSLPEQQKIASFLSAVDEKIQQLTKKKELLEQYKKGVMQQLFSGELRFRDENGSDYADWEEKRLGQIGDLKNGLNKDKKDFGFGSPFVNLMDVFGKCELNNQKFDLVNSNEKEKELYNVLKGDVLFIRSSVKRTGVGETVIIQEDLPDTVYSGFLIRFRDDKKSLYQDYKKYCFSTQDFREELLSYATSSANTNINQESLNKLKVNIPCIEEQQKIATYLSSIDTKIESVNNQITQTQTFKKGLLQQMFV